MAVPPTGPEGAQDGEELLELGVGEHRRGLVEDDHAGCAAQRLGDLDHLALRDAEAADALTRVDVLEAQLGQALAPRPDARPRQSMMPGRPRGHLAQEQVLGHGEVRHEAELLVHGADAQAAGIVWRSRRIGSAVDLHVAASPATAPARMRMSVDLPAPFSPDERVDLAGARPRSRRRCSA